MLKKFIYSIFKEDIRDIIRDIARTESMKTSQQYREWELEHRKEWLLELDTTSSKLVLKELLKDPEMIKHVIQSINEYQIKGSL